MNFTAVFFWIYTFLNGEEVWTFFVVPTPVVLLHSTHLLYYMCLRHIFITSSKRPVHPRKLSFKKVKTWKTVTKKWRVMSVMTNDFKLIIMQKKTPFYKRVHLPRKLLWCDKRNSNRHNISPIMCHFFKRYSQTNIFYEHL